MRRVKLFSALFILILMISVSNLTAQNGNRREIGKLFEREEANKLFGKVIGSLTISAEELKAALAKGNEFILITVKDNQFVIRNESRQFLSNERVELGENERLHVYSKSMLQNLLKSGKPVKKTKSSLEMGAMAVSEDAVTVEVRAEVITLTYGDATLEYSTICPPFCM
jgi:hypothetical protein